MKFLQNESVAMGKKGNFDDLLRSVSSCSIGKTARSVCFLFLHCINSCSAHHSRALRTCPWLAANHPQVREVCELCRSQSTTIADLFQRKLGDEEVKARFQGARG